MTSPPRKTVNRDGMQWTVISTNERSTTRGGRFFFARRCNPASPWAIHEHDVDITAAENAKPLRVWANRYPSTKLLSNVVREIDMKVGHHPSVTFEEHWAAMKARA